ncbi:unnamed protein product [Gadus morhua 'NCC']
MDGVPVCPLRIPRLLSRDTPRGLVDRPGLRPSLASEKMLLLPTGDHSKTTAERKPPRRSTRSMRRCRRLQAFCESEFAIL